MFRSRSVNKLYDLRTGYTFLRDLCEHSERKKLEPGQETHPKLANVLTNPENEKCTFIVVNDTAKMQKIIKDHKNRLKSTKFDSLSPSSVWYMSIIYQKTLVFEKLTFSLIFSKFPINFLAKAKCKIFTTISQHVQRMKGKLFNTISKQHSWIY